MNRSPSNASFVQLAISRGNVSLTLSSYMSFVQVETTSNLDDGTCHGAGYIFEAACQVSQAQQHEANGQFEGAFESYKLGIGILLNGVQCNKFTR
jgi:hypothetical protein